MAAFRRSKWCPERREYRRQLPAIPPAVERYRRERDRYIKLADRIAEI